LRAKLGAWIAAQPEPRPPRSDAIRRLLDEALRKAVGAVSIPTEELNARNDE